MKILNVILFILVALIASLIYSQSSITYDGGTNIEIQAGADVCADAININGTYSGGGTICSGPLPVTVSSFTASVINRKVQLNWTTETELNNKGFDIERRTLSGPPIEAEWWLKIAFVEGSGTTSEPRSYSFEDKKLNTGEYSYRLKQIDYNGSYEYFILCEDIIVQPPADYSISQNYPNPSNPKSKIDYQIPAKAGVTIKLYDLLGREVITLVNEIKEAGYYTEEFDGTNLSSGIYFYSIMINKSNEVFKQTRKLVLMK